MDFSSVLNSLIQKINTGDSISVGETVKSLIEKIPSATSDDKNSASNLLSQLSSKIKSGQYSNEQIGDSAKSIVESLNSELTSGKYSTEQIGEAAKKVFSSMGDKVSNVTNNLSSTALGEQVKDYVSRAKTNISKFSSSELGEKIKNNFDTYKEKIQTNNFTINDFDDIVNTSSGSNHFANNTSNTTTSSSKTTSKKKKKGKGTAVAKTTKKTAKTVKSNTKKKTTTKNSKLKKTSSKKTTTKKANNTTTTVSRSTTSISETIYFDHDIARTNSGTIEECFETIARDNVELQTVLTDLNSFWKGSRATKFNEEIDSYSSLIKKYNECIQDAYDNIKSGSKAYSTFDDYFANKTI